MSSSFSEGFDKLIQLLSLRVILNYSLKEPLQERCLRGASQLKIKATALVDSVS